MKNKHTDTSREGFAMVTTLLVVLVLSVLAVGVTWMASSEKKITFAESVHLRSVFSADAGSEAGINFIRISDSPPRISDFGTMTVQSAGDTLLGSQSYDFNAIYMNKRVKPGWGTGYMDYDYQVRAKGAASTQGESGVQVVVSRLFKEGY